MLEIEICPYKQVVYAQPRIHPEEWDVQTSLGLWNTNRSPNLSQTSKLNDSQQKKRTCWIVDIAFPTDHEVKLKEREKRERYQDLASELKRLWNMKVTVIPIVVGALRTISKGLTRRLRNQRTSRYHSIQTTALWRLARILRRAPMHVWKTLKGVKW